MEVSESPKQLSDSGSISRSVQSVVKSTLKADWLGGRFVTDFPDQNGRLANPGNFLLKR